MTFSVMRLIIGGLILVAIEALNSAAERLEQCTPGF
jgi:diacylglycerol kinase